jgi:cytochrome P450
MISTLPNGPRTPALLQGLGFAFRPAAFLEECGRRYGECFTVRMPVGPPDVFFTNPDAVREIFTADGDDLRASGAALALRPVLGRHAIFFLEGERHARERRLMLPPFHGERMLAYGHAMREITVAALERWPVGRPFRLQDEMQRITFEVILRAVFGVGGSELPRLRACLLRILAVATSPALLLPLLQVDLGRLTPWGRFVRLRREMDGLLRAEFARRRAAAESGSDILSLLLAARDEDGEPMSDQELVDEMRTLLVVGHETTATALTWAFQRIASRPDVLATIRAELARVVGPGPVAPEHIGQLTYLDATIKEVLRLNPIVSEVGRVLTRPMRIGGRDLPAGVVATPCIYLTHRRPDVWPEPERFAPERFLGTRPSPYAFFPFGGGMRRCLGMAFALYEMKIVLAEVLARTDLRAAPGYRPRAIRRSITLAPARGFPVVVEHRPGRAASAPATPAAAAMVA